MAMKRDSAGSVSVPRFDGHRLSEFIYGTVTGMVAVVGIDASHDVFWLGAALIIVVGAAAIWVAHAYSILLGRRIAEGRRLHAGDLFAALRGSWPIVSAGAILSVPLLFTPLVLWSVNSALWVSSGLGVLILALVGVLAGVVTRETWGRRLILAALSTGLGLGIVAVEFAVHH
jgi:hypothetical protein